MPKGVRRKKGAVRPGHGARCLICGMECGKGGSLKVHVENKHSVDYENGYKRCFNGGDFLFNNGNAAEIGLNGEIFVYARVLKVPPKPKKKAAKKRARATTA